MPSRFRLYTKILHGFANTACGSGLVAWREAWELQGVMSIQARIHISLHAATLDLISSDSASRGPNTSQHSPLETSQEIALGLSAA